MERLRLEESMAQDAEGGRGGGGAQAGTGGAIIRVHRPVARKRLRLSTG